MGRIIQRGYKVTFYEEDCGCIVSEYGVETPCEYHGSLPFSLRCGCVVDPVKNEITHYCAKHRKVSEA